MAKSNAPRTFFPIFFGGAAGRPWRVALDFGGRRQRKAPVIGWTAKLADGGGEIAPSVWVTNPRARTFAPWGCGAHITYIRSSACQVDQNGNPGVSTGDADRPSGVWIGLPRNVPDGLSWPPCGLAEYFTSQQILGFIIVYSTLKNGLLGTRSTQMKLNCTNLNKQSFVFWQKMKESEK